MSQATADRSAPAGGEQGTELKRVMGPGLLLLFIVGDILGTGIYALTGDVAQEVGGAVWAPFLVAFAVAMLTAFSYLELVTKYPQAAGAALYAHKAFGIHFLTFLICFTVMCSGITSASTASKAFASNLAKGFGLDSSSPLLVTGIALGFMALVAIVNLRGVGESVKANVVLTLVELSGLLLVIMVGLFAIFGGKGDFSRAVVFDSPSDKSAFFAVTAATALAFFAMVGFEDSVNMAEETKDPERVFPKMMITGLSITGVIYVLVGLVSVILVPVGELGDSDTPLVSVVEAAAPGIPIDTLLPFISMFAVANSALINMLMASRLLYGMARQSVLPPVLGRVHRTRRTPWIAILFTTVLAAGLILYVSGASTDAVATLGGTTSLLLLAVFTVVNICVLVLRRTDRDHDRVRTDLDGNPLNDREPAPTATFRTPTVMAVAGALACAFLVTPMSGRDPEQYAVAGWLLALGLVLWVLTWLANRGLRARRTIVHDAADLSGGEPDD